MATEPLVTPVSGSFSATGQSATFQPIIMGLTQVANFNVTLGGSSWVGVSVQLERSFDQGATWYPLTAAGSQIYIWTSPKDSEPVQEVTPGVFYRLNCTSYTSGAVTYLITQA